MIPITDLKAQQRGVREEIDGRIARVLDHGRYILGPEVDELEEALAAYSGAAHCITCANGTDALQIAFMALGIGPGDEVVTPAFSYIATAEAAVLLGATPVYVDIDPLTFAMDASALERTIGPRTKVIVPVSLYGQPADMDAINAVAARHGLLVVEDAAQSFGGSWHGVRSGTLGTVGCTSFFPSKPLGCYGDGGAMLTSDEGLARELRRIARHGQDRRYHHGRVGVNSRLDTIQAAVLLAKLPLLDNEIAGRDRLAARYKKVLGGNESIAVPSVAPGARSAWAQYTVRVPQRDVVQAALREQSIATAVHYPLPLNRQLAVAREADVPESERAAREVLSLPISPYMSAADQDRVSGSLAAACLELNG